MPKSLSSPAKVLKFRVTCGGIVQRKIWRSGWSLLFQWRWGTALPGGLKLNQRTVIRLKPLRFTQLRTDFSQSLFCSFVCSFCLLMANTLSNIDTESELSKTRWLSFWNVRKFWWHQQKEFSLNTPPLHCNANFLQRTTPINSLALQIWILTLILAQLIGINIVKHGCFYCTHVEQMPLSLGEVQTLHSHIADLSGCFAMI